jgi:CO/xanthine dehydrogenase FAD-binding subunit
MDRVLIMTAIERYAAPTSLAEAAKLLADDDATLLAGGTDLMPQTRTGMKTFAPLLLSLRRIPELRGIAASNGAIRIGALTTVTDLLQDSALAEKAPVLPETADCFASDQVRNCATIGGNICNASPAGDLIIPLLLLDADVELLRWEDGKTVTRRIPLCEFFVGPGQARIRPDEILTAATFTVPAKGYVAGFEKFGARPALDISVVSVGIAGIKESDRLKEARVAFGAVAPTPLRGRRTEAVIGGQTLTEKMIDESRCQAVAEISPITDVRASEWYRRELVRVLTERVLRRVLQA